MSRFWWVPPLGELKLKLAETESFTASCDMSVMFNILLCTKFYLKTVICRLFHALCQGRFYLKTVICRLFHALCQGSFRVYSIAVLDHTEHEFCNNTGFLEEIKIFNCQRKMPVRVLPAQLCSVNFI
jgi:hypothetical protein